MSTRFQWAVPMLERALAEAQERQKQLLDAWMRAPNGIDGAIMHEVAYEEDRIDRFALLLWSCQRGMLQKSRRQLKEEMTKRGYLDT